MDDVKQRLLREAANMVGKEELARRMNVPVTLLDAWMRGLATMPDRKILPLADLMLDKLEREKQERERQEQFKKDGPENK
jgi:transcriptional regulator with XRE-family HTH domain